MPRTSIDRKRIPRLTTLHAAPSPGLHDLGIAAIVEHDHFLRRILRRRTRVGSIGKTLTLGNCMDSVPMEKNQFPGFQVDQNGQFCVPWSPTCPQVFSISDPDVRRHLRHHPPSQELNNPTIPHPAKKLFTGGSSPYYPQCSLLWQNNKG